MTDPQTMSNEELAAAVDEMFNSPDFDRIKFEAARRLREHADLEAACKVLGEECRAWRKWWDLTPTEPGWTPKPLVDARRSTDAHPVAAGYVKPKETNDGH